MPVEVFISWSGVKSKVAAEEIALSLPVAVPGCKPWISTNDIPSGSRWSQELSEALGRCTAALLLLTTENLGSPWVLFEAGAISRPIARSNIIPVLLDFEPNLLPAPLAQFQSEKLNEAGFLRICAALDASKQLKSKRSGSHERAKEAWKTFAPTIDRINQTYRSMNLRQRARAHYVTQSEMRVLEQLGQGLTPRQVAELNGVALSTVRTQIMSLRLKLSAANLGEIVAFAREDGLLLE